MLNMLLLFCEIIYCEYLSFPIHSITCIHVYFITILRKWFKWYFPIWKYRHSKHGTQLYMSFCIMKFEPIFIKYICTWNRNVIIFVKVNIYCQIYIWHLVKKELIGSARVRNLKQIKKHQYIPKHPRVYVILYYFKQKEKCSKRTLKPISRN